MAKGVEWKRVQAKAMNPNTQKIYASYIKKVNEAGLLATELKQASEAEWVEKNPNGINGQVAIFNAINGVLLFAFKPLDLAKNKGKKEFDADAGENPFTPSFGKRVEAEAA
jgi:hypothetical protein